MSDLGMGEVGMFVVDEYYEGDNWPDPDTGTCFKTIEEANAAFDILTIDEHLVRVEVSKIIEIGEHTQLLETVKAKGREIDDK